MVWEKLQNRSVCVALSGGADSVALLHFLKSQKEQYGYSLSAAHCEHGIRGEESLDDMRFAQALCKAWDIPLTLFQTDCVQRAKAQKESLETAARNFRYECFFALLEGGSADFIATAHHLGDEAETVLFRLARGSALSGLTAMQKSDERFLRPLLGWSKGQILEYIEKNGLSYRTDSTNLQADATRNKLRLEILPALERAIPGASENIARFAILAKEDDDFLYALSNDLVEGNLVKFSDKKPLFTRACLTVMKKFGVQKDYTSTHLNALFDLQGLERGAYLCLPKDIRAEKTEKGIAFYRFEEETPFPKSEEQPFALTGFDGGRYEVKIDRVPISEGNGWRILRLDLDKIPPSARFRFRQEGDKIERFGGGKKSLKKFFNEEKIPPKEREYLPLIAEREKKVYAVCGVEIAESVKVDENTKNCIYIAIRKKES